MAQPPFIQISLAPPKAELRMDEMLPSLRALHDAFVSAAVQRQAKPITCAKGCSACCRIQPVPITPAEAYAVYLLVEGMPPERRAALRARFADCETSLARAGLLDSFLQGRRPGSEAQAKREAQQYLELGLVCPFLEDDCCSIYTERPLACREYLVTTPKENCTNPLNRPVTTVPVLVGAAAVLSIESESFGHPLYAIPLTLAYSWAKDKEDLLRTTFDGKQVFPRAIDRLNSLWNCYVNRD